MSEATENIQEAEENVNDAISAVEEAANDAPNEEVEVALEEIKDVLAQAKEVLDTINSKAKEAEATPEAETGSETHAEQTAASEPEVAVGEGKTEYRHVRRLGRKVKRKV